MLGHLGRGRQEVVDERRRQRVAGVVVDEVLEQHAADALHDAAEDLALDDRRVDHRAAVLRDDVAQDLRHAGVAVDLDDAEVGGVRPRREARRAGTARSPPARLTALAAACSAKRYAADGDLLHRRSTRAGVPCTNTAPVLDVEVVRRGLQRVGGDGEHLVPHGLGRLPGPRRRRPPRCGLPPVPGPYGVDCGVALDDRDVVVVDAEGVGDDLGHRRLDALPVRRRAEVGDDLAARLDPHGGALGGQASVRPSTSARRRRSSPRPSSRPSARAVGLLGLRNASSRAARAPARASPAA